MIYLINKPKGWTSFDVVAKIKGQLQVKKIGHAGTLDPLATGLLIVLTDRDTKRQAEFMSMQKEYVAGVSFGITTPSDDLETIPHLVKKVNLEEIKKYLPEWAVKFIGEIEQRVPEYSAIKVKGQPLYKKARKGLLSVSDTPIKKVTIYDLEVDDFVMREIETDVGLVSVPEVTIKVTCSSGTYIRALARDLGEMAGTKATMTSLVRTKIGDYKLEGAKAIEDLKS